MTSTSGVGLVEITQSKIGRRRKITRLEMVAILEAYSRAGGSLVNGYVPGTVPRAFNELQHFASEEESAAIMADVPDEHHRRAAKAWARICGGITLVSVGDGMRDGCVRYDQPGSMAPGQHAALMFVPSSLSSESIGYLRGKCGRLIVVDNDSLLVIPPAADRDLDGTWNSFVYLCQAEADLCRVYLEEFGGEDPGPVPRTYEAPLLEPYRVLQMIDPNSGQGWDPKGKQRYQYVSIDDVICERMLPPESFGDVWRGEATIRPFLNSRRTGGQPVSDFIQRLLNL